MLCRAAQLLIPAQSDTDVIHAFDLHEMPRFPPQQRTRRHPRAAAREHNTHTLPRALRPTKHTIYPPTSEKKDTYNKTNSKHTTRCRITIRISTLTLTHIASNQFTIDIVHVFLPIQIHSKNPS